MYKWNLASSSNCQHCKEIDTVEQHVFYCTASSNFWPDIFQWLHHIVNCKVNLSICEILFGIVNCPYGDLETVTIINLCILLVKWYINACKIGDRQPLLAPFTSLVKEKLLVFKLNSVLNGSLDTYYKMYGKLDKYLL